MKKFKRDELPRRYITEVLYRWDDKKFKDEYLKKWEMNWER